MSKPHAKSTMKEMKDYIRKNKLNKAQIKLTMRKPEMISALKITGHWDSKFGGGNFRQKTPATKPAPKKKLTYSLPKGKDPDKHKQDLMVIYRKENRKTNTDKKIIDGITKELKKPVYQTKTKTRVGGTGGDPNINKNIISLFEKRKDLTFKVMDMPPAQFRKEITPEIKKIEGQITQSVKRKLQTMGMKFNKEEDKNLDFFMGKVRGNDIPTTSKGIDKMTKDFFDMAKQGFAIREPRFERWD